MFRKRSDNVACPLPVHPGAAARSKGAMTDMGKDVPRARQRIGVRLADFLDNRAALSSLAHRWLATESP